jgi:hypothetical protein
MPTGLFYLNILLELGASFSKFSGFDVWSADGSGYAAGLTRYASSPTTTQANFDAAVVVGLVPSHGITDTGQHMAHHHCCSAKSHGVRDLDQARYGVKVKQLARLGCCAPQDRTTARGRGDG